MREYDNMMQFWIFANIYTLCYSDETRTRNVALRTTQNTLQDPMNNCGHFDESR
jgi:hypothetical protein